MDDQLPTSGSRSPTTSHPLAHGHAPVPWSAELDKIKAPTLSETEPEDFVNFRVKYEDYAKRLMDVAERHNTIILPKPVFDCIEKYTLKYLCNVSDLLPPENRGDPANVDPEILHKAIMEVNTSMLPDRTSKLLEEVSKVKIHIDGKQGLRSIAKAWERLLYLQERYRAEVVPKVVVKTLLEGLTPPSVRSAILNMQRGGTPEERQSYKDTTALHAVLVRVARIAKSVTFWE